MVEPLAAVAPMAAVAPRLTVAPPAAAGPRAAKTLLITAGAYVGAEIAAEFGRMPPAFLPVGNRRLIVHQHAALSGCFDRILLTIPHDFELSDQERGRLEALGLEIVMVPVDLSLPSSILFVLAECAIEGDGLAVLHGDSLIYDIPYEQPDTMSVALADDAYDWTACRVEDDRVVGVLRTADGNLEPGPVLSGFFHFADLNHLVLSLAASNGDFTNAMQRYVSKRPMHAVTSTRWLDFGHLHTYYSSRGRITTERAFNSLVVSDRVVAKRSTRTSRIEAEANWYERIPTDLRIYLPHYLGRSTTSDGQAYALEFLYMASLSDLFVFGRLPEAVWLRIFGSCALFLKAAAAHAAPLETAARVMDLYLPKTLQRLDEYGAATGIDPDRPWRINGVAVPGLREIAAQSAALITPPEPRHLSVVHGDACFSNILYDFRSHSVRVIDPRGQDGQDRPTIWGDNRYDLAKIHHSIVGFYDLIVAGYCTVSQVGDHAIDLRFPDDRAYEGACSAFRRTFVKAYAEDWRAIEAISLHLFLSMLPLHSDSPVRQQALLANALRLYTSLIQEQRP